MDFDNKEYKKNKCKGCAKNEKATWCKIRACCIEKEISTCAECKDFHDVKQCSKYNNVFARMIEFVSRTDRSLSIEMIKNDGLELFAEHMNLVGKMSLQKEKRKL